MDHYIWVVCGSKNRHQKETCLKRDRVRAQKLVTILSLVVTISEEELYDHLIRYNYSI